MSRVCCRLESSESRLRLAYNLFGWLTYEPGAGWVPMISPGRRSRSSGTSGTADEANGHACFDDMRTRPKTPRRRLCRCYFSDRCFICVANASRHLSGALGFGAEIADLPSNGFRITSLRVRIVQSVLFASDHGGSGSWFLYGESISGWGFGAPNGTVAKLRAPSHTNSDAARQLPRQTLVWRERSATGVTPSQMSQPRRFSAGPKYRRIDSFSY
jgi:hypothetical protein